MASGMKTIMEEEEKEEDDWYCRVDCCCSNMYVLLFGVLAFIVKKKKLEQFQGFREPQGPWNGSMRREGPGVGAATQLL